MPPSIGALIRCVKHIPPQQLARRAWLTAKRRMLSSRTARALYSRRRQLEPPPINAKFSSHQALTDRTAVFEQAGKYALRQLGLEVSLEPPIDWLALSHPHHTHLQRLALHYHDFLAELPVQKAIDTILDWISANPLYQKGYWKDAWSSYALSIRCVAWMQFLLKHRSALTAEQERVILASLNEQLVFLTHNLETDIRGNHLIKNLRCLLWAGSFFEGPQATHWHRMGLKLLREEIRQQLLSDGMHFELSPAYHCQVFVDLLESVQFAADLDRQQLLSVLEPSAQAIADLTHPDGKISLFSDGGLQMVHSPAECLELWEVMGKSRVSPRREIVLAESGYYGVRFPETYFLADCGPICADSLPAHGHADVLSFEWDVFGTRVIVDAGVGEYENGPRRYWGRCTAAHNTVTVNHQDQAELIGSFRTGDRSAGQMEKLQRDGNVFCLTGSYQFPVRLTNALHRRSFEVQPRSVSVRDAIEGAPNQEAVSRLLISHDVQVELLNDHAAVLRFNGHEVHFQSTALVRMRKVSWSPNFGEWQETLQLELAYGSTPCSHQYSLTVLH